MKCTLKRNTANCNIRTLVGCDRCDHYKAEPRKGQKLEPFDMRAYANTLLRGAMRGRG